MKIGMLAGEASGDMLGAKVIEALKQRCPELEIEGIGGQMMNAAGCRSLFDIERLSVMGLVEPLMRLPDLIKLRRDLIKYFTSNKPDLFIGIDSPDFNLGLELKLREAGIPTVHYVSPSVWAWRQGRINKISRAVDMMLTLLPFETKFYQDHNVPVRYVGHPLADQVPLEIDTNAARRALCLNQNATYVGLLVGSRKQEIKQMAEPYLLAAYELWKQRPNVRFLASHVNEERYREFSEVHKRVAPDLPLQIFTRRTQDVMAASDVVVVTSGTATLETMLHKKPMVIAYRMPWLTHRIAKLLVKTPYIGLPNLLADEMLVPELIQDKVTPENIAKEVSFFLDSPQRVTELKEKFVNMHRHLRQDSATVIAETILALTKQS